MFEMRKDQLIDWLWRWAKVHGQPVTKKELAGYSSRQLYGAWYALAFRGEVRCGIIEQIRARRSVKAPRARRQASRVQPASPVMNYGDRQMAAANDDTFRGVGKR